MSEKRATIASPLLLTLCAALLCASLGCEDKKTTTTTTQQLGTQGGDAAAGDTSSSDFVAGSKAPDFTTVLAADPETFDTAKMSGAPEGRLAFNLFEGLLMPGPTTEGLDDPSKLVVPGVATSFEVSSDGKTYTFTLREDARWSNGDPVTSQDFVYAWKRVLTPGFPADYAQMLWAIKGAQQYNEGKNTDWAQVGITADSPTSLKVELNAPTPYFPELVAFYTFFPVHQKTVEAHGDDWTRPEHIVSNGAYTLAKYEPQKDAYLEKSTHYWDRDSVKLAKIRMRIISDINAVVNAYKTGELHWTGTPLPVAQISNLLMHPDYVRHPLLGTYYYRINVSKEGSALQDNRVRDALKMGVDREQLINQTLKGLHLVANSYVPRMAGYETAYQIGGNAKKAKKLLEEAGYGPDKPLKITLLYNTDENHKLVAESVQAMWKSNLGVDVTLENKEWKTYLQDIDTLSYEVARAGWIGDYNDPMTFLDMWVTGNGNNDTGWSDAEYDKLIADATQEVDRARRLAFLQQAEKILLERGPVIPIYWYTNSMLASRHMKGFQAHNRDINLFKYLALPDSK